MADANNVSLYPFPANQKCTYTAPWWQWVGARLFGQRFHELQGSMEVDASWWRGRLYVRYIGPIR